MIIIYVTSIFYFYLNLVPIKQKKTSNTESQGWEFKVGKRLGYELAKASDKDKPELPIFDTHTKYVNFRPSKEYRQMNERYLLKNDREDYLDTSLNNSRISSKRYNYLIY